MGGQRMYASRFLFIGCILALCLLLVVPLSAQQPAQVCEESQYFPDSGHNVCDRFLKFFRARGGARIFGYPITEQFVEDGRLVQYFQRVRMEYHPELPPAYHVQLGLLGDFLAPPQQKARIADSDRPKSNDPQRRYFPETGHTVGLAFLEFFNENGGIDNFGYPVTEFMLENSRPLQYFQRALMEWNPNQGGIVLHNLGEMWIEQHAHLRSLRDSTPQLSIVGPAVNSLEVTASVRDAFTGLVAEQMVWVYVNDQNGAPVVGAQVTLTASFLSENQVFSMPPTDELGHTQIAFGVDGLSPGQLAIVDVTVTFNALTARTWAFFFAWW